MDLARTREAQARGQAEMFGKAIRQLGDDIENPETLDYAREVLKKYHADMKKNARKES